MAVQPYKVSAIWTEETLPQAIRREHRTKEGVWGLLRVLEGEARLHFDGEAEPILVTPQKPALIPPQKTHHVECRGAVRMRVEFYREAPRI
jgi:tellurite resistance-related uncharacterized protein